MSYHILIRTYKFVKYIFQIPKYCPPRWTCQKLIDIPLILLSYFFCVELATCFGCWVTSTKIFHQNLSLVFRWCPPYFLYKISWYVDYLMMTGTQKFFFFCSCDITPYNQLACWLQWLLWRLSDHKWTQVIMKGIFSFTFVFNHHWTSWQFKHRYPSSLFFIGHSSCFFMTCIAQPEHMDKFR